MSQSWEKLATTYGPCAPRELELGHLGQLWFVFLVYKGCDLLKSYDVLNFRQISMAVPSDRVAKLN